MDPIAGLETVAGLALLALVAFCDTLIGIGFFVFGELAFLAAGTAFAANGAIAPVMTVFVFAWLGDLTSYGLGRMYGPRLALRFMMKRKNRVAWRAAKTTLARHGLPFVVLSRLLGPVAWITPFLAGALGMRAQGFAPAAAFGVALGAGQFVLLGAVGYSALDYVLPFVMPHLFAIFLLAAMLLTGIWLWYRSTRPYLHRLTTVTVAASAIFVAVNFSYFFVLDMHPAPTGPRPNIVDVCQIADTSLIVRPGQSSLHLPQPVNVLLFSKNSGAELMTHLGWLRNQTYSHDRISFSNFLDLLLRKTPPMSELYLDDHPADSAFQMPGTIKTREHIRWWAVGAGLHFGALSKTDEIAIKYYGRLPAILHDIDPRVDLSRDMLAVQTEGSIRYDVVGIAAIAQPVQEGAVSDFETDGGVLVLTDHGYRLPAGIRECLRIEPFA